MPSELDWWLERAGSLEWTWASTFADIAPHSYVVLGRTPGLTREEVQRAARVIETYGEPGKYWQTLRIYLHDPERNLIWWVMVPDVTKVEGINQGPADINYGPQDVPSTKTGRHTLYDDLSPDYDRRYQSPQDRMEEVQVWRHVVISAPAGQVGRVLDIGAGTGLALDIRLVRYGRVLDYRAVDPSQGMLNQLLLKHPWVRDFWPMTAEEYLARVDPLAEPFDTVLSLFGAASYLAPDTIKALPLTARGLVVLMHYEAGYRPSYYTDETWPDGADESREAAAALVADYRGEVSKIGHFQVVTVWPWL